MGRMDKIAKKRITKDHEPEAKHAAAPADLDAALETMKKVRKEDGRPVQLATVVNGVVISVMGATKEEAAEKLRAVAAKYARPKAPAKS